MSLDLCPIEECDVKDKESLNQFRDCLLRWNRWLFDAPHNALINQILRMLQHDATFRMINSARELSINSPNEKVGFNWLFLQSYDYGYASSQLSTIRKLACDKRTDVISLNRLIKDIRENYHLFTRENYVCYNGAPFDPKEGQIYLFSELRHKCYDMLCNDGSSKIMNRKQNFPVEILEKLTNKLSSCNNLARVVHKFIAHAGELDTQENDGLYKVTLDKIFQCHKEICQVFSFISGHLLNIRSSGLMPEFLGSPSINMDKSFCITEDLDKLDKFWENYKKGVGSWNQEVVSGEW